jgi:hypothetical protein
MLASFSLVIGFDFSWGALSIAKSSVPSGHFVEMDAENIEIHAKNLTEQCASRP